MRKIVTSILGIGSIAFFCAGCATSFPVGSLYTELGLPVGATSNVTGSKKGVAKCQSVLGLVATGDASIDAAKKKRWHHDRQPCGLAGQEHSGHLRRVHDHRVRRLTALTVLPARVSRAAQG